METMTAEQALSNAKSHTFESVWATLDRIAEENERRKREADERYEQYKAEDERRKREADERYEKYERERREADEKRKAEDERRKREADEEYRKLRESQEKTEKMIAELSRNIGGLGNSFGRFTEAMLSPEMYAKFNALGYEFHDQSVNRKYTDGKKTVAEADVVLENGEYILLAEIKTEPRGEDVDEHIARIEKVRAHMDRRNDRRKILGAIAGGVVPDKVLAYAQGGGLFVITLSGESAALAALPEGFTPRVW